MQTAADFANRNTPIRLPVLALTFDSYRHVIANRSLAAELSIKWLPGSLLAMILACWMLWPLTQAPYVDDVAAQALFAAVLCFLPLPVFAAVAIVWHRFMLSGEHPSAAGAARLDHKAVAYTLLNTTPLLPLIALSGLISAPGHSAILLAVMIFTAVVAVVVMAVSLRLGLMLPAIAVSRPMRTSDAWVATRRQTLAMIAGTILTLLPALVVPALLQLPIGTNPSRSTFALVVALEEMSGALLTFFYVAFLSFAYRALVDTDTGEALQ